MDKPADPFNALRLFKRQLTTSWFGNVALIIAWLVVWQFGRLVEYTEHASVWFPAAGLTYAALLIIGPRAIPALMLCAILSTFWVGHHYQLALNTWQLLWAGLLFGIAHITPYFISSKFIRSISQSQQVNASQLIIAFLVSSAVASLLTTFCVIWTLVTTQMMPASAVTQAWLAFWIGDLAGVIVLAPLFCAILTKFYRPAKFTLSHYLSPNQLQASKDYKIKLLVVLTLISASMLLAKYANTSESAFAIFFLVIPHMWIACSESAFFNTLSLAFSSFVIACLVHFLGLMEFVMVYQFAINVIAANALFGIAVPALTAQNRHLTELVVTDALTLAASRQHFMQCAKRAVVRSHGDEGSLSLIVFDVDNFKQINDIYGHSAGDKALRDVSRVAKLSLRPTDLLGRFGGDEFVALLPGSTIEDASRTAKRILHSLNAIEVAKQQYIQCSFGVAQLAPAQDFPALFEQADRALYHAKKRGRNQIMTAHKPCPS